jgi:GT2 family glycosyltransferase
MLDDIGLYDEDFFAYADETDMGWRAQLAGWKCIYSPKAIVYHLHSISSGGRYSSFKAFLVERNRIWVALKNFPNHSWPVLYAVEIYLSGLWCLEGQRCGRAIHK